MDKNLLFSCVLRDSTPRFVGLSVGPLVRLSVRLSIRLSHFTFSAFLGFWACCSCPNDPLILDMAPTHPHATGVAVYPALLNFDAWPN